MDFLGDFCLFGSFAFILILKSKHIRYCFLSTEQYVCWRASFKGPGAGDPEATGCRMGADADPCLPPSPLVQTEHPLGAVTPPGFGHTTAMANTVTWPGPVTRPPPRSPPLAGSYGPAGFGARTSWCPSGRVPSELQLEGGNGDVSFTLKGPHPIAPATSPGEKLGRLPRGIPGSPQGLGSGD